MPWRDLLPDSLSEKLHPYSYGVRRELEIFVKDNQDLSIVLDAGAGDCRYQELFRRSRHISIDINKSSVPIDAIADIRSLPFKAGGFDAVLCLEVLEHVRDPASVLKEFFRTLRSGGKLLVSTPLKGIGFHPVPDDFYRYTPSSLAELFTEAGFEVLYIKPNGGYFWNLGLELSRLPGILFRTKSRGVTFLLRVPLTLLFGILLPLLCFHLDALDEEKTETAGYIVCGGKGSLAK